MISDDPKDNHASLSLERESMYETIVKFKLQRIALRLLQNLNRAGLYHCYIYNNYYIKISCVLFC